MDWDDLRYVLALRREGTLSAAAATLRVTRTTVGRRLKEVETRLRVRLFDRSDAGLSATRAGAELAEAAMRIETEILTSERRLLGRDAELRGALRVSTVDFLFAGFPEIFASFAQRYPGVTLTVGVTGAQVSLPRREADIVLRLGHSKVDRLVGHRVARVQFAVYAARALVGRDTRKPMLAELPWIHLDGSADRAWLDRWLAKNAPGAQVSFRSDDFAVRRRAVSAGIGAHILPCFDGDSDTTLVRVSRLLVQEARDLWVLTLPEYRDNRRIGAFFGHVHEEFTSRKRVLEGTSAARAE